MPHLTEQQRHSITTIFDGTDPTEVLYAVAGIVAHITDDYITGMIASEHIRACANILTKTADPVACDPVKRNTAIACADKSIRNLRHATDLLPKL